VQTFDLLSAMVLACAAIWCINRMQPVTIMLLVLTVFWIAVGVWAFR
jgi:uncharacterized membrane protein YqjE